MLVGVPRPDDVTVQRHYVTFAAGVRLYTEPGVTVAHCSPRLPEAIPVDH